MGAGNTLNFSPPPPKSLQMLNHLKYLSDRQRTKPGGIRNLGRTVFAFAALCACTSHKDATPLNPPNGNGTGVQPPITYPTPSATGGVQPTQQSPSWTFWVDPNSNAARDALSASGPDAQRLKYIASQGTARWYSSWSGDIAGAVAQQVQEAAQQNAVAVMVAYNIPNRDCGGFSGGQTTSAADYRSWINGFASTLGGATTVVILEPDALAQDKCLDATRFALLHDAITVLKSKPGTLVYVDAGHSAWVDATTMASRLTQVGVQNADGFALNVSNYQKNSDLIAYANAIRAAGVNKNYVIDTSRNGNGPNANNDWCNPPGRALGHPPAHPTDVPGLDAYLWVKVPGESDGTCNGGPDAGTWWRDLAISLATNAGI